MQLRYDQLPNHLQKKLDPIYIISGEEPLLMQEACDAVRQTAQQNGFAERVILQTETGFNWDQLTTSANTLSLFNAKQLIELRLNHSPNETGIKALQTYIKDLPEDKILLIITGKMDKKAQQSTWFKALATIAAFVQIWPIETQHLPKWIAQRLAQANLKADAEGIQLLSNHAEGNLLAAAQEIEKLSLLYTSGSISSEAIAQAISDSARFDVFNLIDTALQGNKQRVIRVLASLKGENIEPTLVLWALARELRALASMAYSLTMGLALEKILQEQRVWEKRKPLIRLALQRHHLNNWHTLIRYASNIDRMIKGVKSGNVWDELQRLSLAIAGLKL